MDISAIGATADSLFSILGDRQPQMRTLAQTFLSRGADRYTKGDYEGAAREFRRSASFDPSHDNAVKAYDMLATTYLQQNRNEDAVKAYQTSLSIAPDNGDAHMKLGNIYFSQGSYTDAEKEYKAGVSIDPTSSTNIYSLGQVYLVQGRYQEAEKQFERVISINPAHESGYYALGQTYAKEGRYEDAIGQFEKALSIKSGFYSAYVDLGYAYADLKRTDRAQEQLNVLYANSPSMAPLLQNYLDEVTNPKLIAAYGFSGFNTASGPNTPVYQMNSTLLTPKAAQKFDIMFFFSKDMDSVSIQNPYNWSISRAQAGSPGGSYNWGLPVSSAEAQVSPIPVSVIYQPDLKAATVSFLIKQNADANGTIDPSHLTFKFNGQDIYGNAMDASADEYNGISKIV